MFKVYSSELTSVGKLILPTRESSANLLFKTEFTIIRIYNFRLEFITNLIHKFIYSIIILHHVPQHVSNIAVLIFRRIIVYLQYLVSSHSVWQHTECDDSRYCK
jgi:hypothetical protein